MQQKANKASADDQLCKRANATSNTGRNVGLEEACLNVGERPGLDAPKLDIEHSSSTPHNETLACFRFIDGSSMTMQGIEYYFLTSPLSLQFVS